SLQQLLCDQFQCRLGPLVSTQCTGQTASRYRIVKGDEQRSLLRGLDSHTDVSVGSSQAHSAFELDVARHSSVLQALVITVCDVLLGMLLTAKPGTQEIRGNTNNDIGIVKAVMRHNGLTKASFIRLDDTAVGNCIHFNQFGSRILLRKASDRRDGGWTVNRRRYNSYLLPRSLGCA